MHNYKKKMGAVDCSDQMGAYSSFKRRTLKWWKKVFFTRHRPGYAKCIHIVPGMVRGTWWTPLCTEGVSVKTEKLFALFIGNMHKL